MRLFKDINAFRALQAVDEKVGEGCDQGFKGDFEDIIGDRQAPEKAPWKYTDERSNKNESKSIHGFPDDRTANGSGPEMFALSQDFQ